MPNTMTLPLRFSRMVDTISSFFCRVMALVTCSVRRKQAREISKQFMLVGAGSERKFCVST